MMTTKTIVKIDENNVAVIDERRLIQSKATLEQQKERLIARLAEIEEMLQKIETDGS